MAPRKPTQAQVQEQSQSAARGPVKVASPAWVLSYDRATQTATIQIATSYRVRDDAGDLVARVRPPISNVPVQFSGSVTWDLEEGEWGMALICDRSIDEWKATGNQGSEPRDPRRFDITDAVFLPGVMPPAAPLPAGALPSVAPPNDAVVLWHRDKAGGLKLGDSTASELVALESAVDAWNDVALGGGLVSPLDELIAAYAAAVGVAPVALPALKVAIGLGIAYRSSVVKAV